MGMDLGDGCGGWMDGKGGGLGHFVCVQRSWRRVGEKGFGWGGGGVGERMLGGGYLSYCHTMRIRVYQKKKKKDKSGNSTL